jgi:hypothetical protein
VTGADVKARPTLGRVSRRLGITIVTAALSVAGVASVAQATETLGLHTPVAVSPSRGTPATTFTIRFTTPVAIGSSGGLRTWEVASVAKRGRSSRSCTSSMAVTLRPALTHHHFRVGLSALKPWCTGKYTGTITLYRTIICNPGPPSQRAACPEIAFAPQLIGHFRFTVAHAAS